MLGAQVKWWLVDREGRENLELSGRQLYAFDQLDIFDLFMGPSNEVTLRQFLFSRSQ
jgi:hypothetical protein